ncbi:hypothetical protein V5O48_016554 [Marasmius crinis-equi]|uniref:chitin deacetylase n=1 Tax=Marasmius crinis-equi TaxID=585013 RepID=A0ABR3ERD9_9AGAR
MVGSTLLCLALAVVSVQSHALHEHSTRRRFFKEGEWAHPQNHSINALFKRATDGLQYATVGSDEWTAKYPSSSSTPSKDSIPKEWSDALSAAIAAGKIPDTPLANKPGDANGDPTYPDGTDPMSSGVCSSTYKCRDSTALWDGPDGTYGISFDDGPLEENKETATHFMIGSNIRANFKQFQEIFDYGGDCAVHTWSHSYMTTLPNEDVLSELGWTMQIIHDSTGGKVPKYWRPPYGDSDVRVRAIAKEVFGMETVIWNQDTDDWGMNEGQNTMENVMRDLNTWLTGPKSPGLIVLEHESGDQTVKAFMDAYPIMKSNGWQTKSLVSVLGDSAYQNVKGDTVFPASIYDPKANANAIAGATNSTSSSAPATSASPTSASSTGGASPTNAGDRAGNGSVSFRDSSRALSFVMALSFLFFTLA